jgi:DNA-binding response OmpR family regulator
MHILIVEDNTLVASGIRAGLELHGFASDTAASVAQAARPSGGAQPRRLRA